MALYDKKEVNSVPSFCIYSNFTQEICGKKYRILQQCKTHASQALHKNCSINYTIYI